MADTDGSVNRILDELSGERDGKDRVTFGDMIEAVGFRGFGAFLMVPALLELTPIGAIPGVPTALASFVALVSIQLLVGRNHLWFPAWMENRTLSSDSLDTAVEKLRPVARFLDRWFHGRMRWITKGPAVRVAAAACIALCLTVPPLELVPFASSAPMLAIAAFGLALIVQDGVLFVIAWIGWLAALTAGFSFLF